MDVEISVVIPAHDRPAGLDVLVAALRAQSLSTGRFEVIVVDDGSAPALHIDADGLTLRVLRHAEPRGPGAARNTGWRAAAAPLVAFVDDDCVPAAGWLAAMLQAGAGDDGTAIIQGRVEPAPAQREARHPLSHTIEVGGLSPLLVSANIAYSRALLQRIGGFDESFRHSAEDVELGARAVKAGGRPCFAAEALVFHEVRTLHFLALVRHTFKWTDSVRALSLHPELRELLIGGVFWKPTHPRLLLAIAGLSTRRRVLVALAAAPYLLHYARLYGGSPGALVRALPTHVAIDACEIATVAAGSVRHRTLML